MDIKNKGEVWMEVYGEEVNNMHLNKKYKLRWIKLSTF